MRFRTASKLGVVVPFVLLLAAPVAAANSASGNEWRPPANRDPASGLARPHGMEERLHERWLPAFSLNLALSRHIALGVICDLGVIALAITDCAVAVNEPSSNVLILSPRSPAGGGSAPDFGDLRRRTIEERMHSI